jgi:cyclopropane-fatty-acyl-phospholipid synthase
MDPSVEGTFAALIAAAAELPPFAFRLWDGTELASRPGAAPRFTVVINNPGAMATVFARPDLKTLGEAYLRDDLDVEGDLDAAHGLLSVITRLFESPTSMAVHGEQAALAPSSPANMGDTPIPPAPHTRERDAEAIRFHYDLSNHVFGLITGPTGMYSAAYFHSEDDSLDAAQRQKLDRVCQKLQMARGERLLDIGCGWGGMMLHAVATRGVLAAGVTVSRQQEAFCTERFRREGAAEHCTVLLQDYRDVDVSRPYDKIVSLGMVEHVGTANLPVYFAKAFAALRPGGLFLLQGVSACAGMPTGASPFAQQYLFPDADMPYIQQYIAAAEAAGFELRDVENMREHYALTHRCWGRNLERHRDVIRAEIGERQYRALRLLYSYGAHFFLDRHSTVSQLLLFKPPGRGLHLPLRRPC